MSAVSDLSLTTSMLDMEKLAACHAERLDALEAEKLRSKGPGTPHARLSWLLKELQRIFPDCCSEFSSEAPEPKYIAAIERLRAELANRDRDWVLAMASALGTNSGYMVPIIPEPKPFEELFAAIIATARNDALTWWSYIDPFDMYPEHAQLYEKYRALKDTK